MDGSYFSIIVSLPEAPRTQHLSLRSSRTNKNDVLKATLDDLAAPRDDTFGIGDIVWSFGEDRAPFANALMAALLFLTKAVVAGDESSRWIAQAQFWLGLTMSMWHRSWTDAGVLISVGGDNAMAVGSRDHEVQSSAPRDTAEFEVDLTTVRGTMSWMTGAKSWRKDHDCKISRR